MARLAASCLSSDDELPDLKALLGNPASKVTRSTSSTTKSPTKGLIPKSSSVSSSRRVRRLAYSNEASSENNPLFGKWNSGAHQISLDNLEIRSRESSTTKGKKLRNRAPRISPALESTDDDESEPESQRPTKRGPPIKRDEAKVTPKDDSDEASESDTEALLTRIRRLRAAKTTQSATTDSEPRQPKQPKDRSQSKRLATTTTKKEPSHDESLQDDPSVYQTAEDESSDYSDGSSLEFDPDDSPGRPGAPRTRSLIKDAPSLKPRSHNLQKKRATGDDEGLDNPRTSRKTSSGTRKASRNTRATSRTTPQETSTAAELADTFSKLRLQLDEFSDEEAETKSDRYTTPPSTPPRTTNPKGLVSPSKRIQIPQTPHRPSMDSFWNPDVVNDWNDLYSPRKLILPSVTKSPAKASLVKEQKDSKKAFALTKHALAEDFLRELDDKITDGKIAQLAESAGGVRLVWTKTLNKTAGRANWKKETIRTKKPGQDQVTITHKHHAFIELAEKVVDDENRLLNVLAHEFCHLANFMVSGIRNNPHGKEFKAWGSKCSRIFADRGIQVTTKHTYDIDFKYRWACTVCAYEYKRHSKSIDPLRHRCGGCKGLLRQTKPVPRGDGKPTRYQAFVTEQMKIVREQNPGSPQKDVMRLIADKWAKEGGGGAGGKKGGEVVTQVVRQIVDMTLED